jgi:hypothetical protein
VLLLLFVGAGVGYVWYEGRHGSVATNVEATPDPVRQQMIKPTQQAPDAVIGASVQYITSPVAQGANAMITVKTNTEAKCTIAVLYNNVPSKDSGLVAHTADEFGAVNWTWTVDPTAPLGVWPVTITCANAKHTAVVKADLKVEKPAQPSATN